MGNTGFQGPLGLGWGMSSTFEMPRNNVQMQQPMPPSEDIAQPMPIPDEAAIKKGGSSLLGRATKLT